MLLWSLRTQSSPKTFWEFLFVHTPVNFALGKICGHTVSSSDALMELIRSLVRNSGKIGSSSQKCQNASEHSSVL